MLFLFVYSSIVKAVTEFNFLSKILNEIIINKEVKKSKFNQPAVPHVEPLNQL